MSNLNKCLISKDNGKLQLPYGDYVALMESVKKGQELLETRDRIVGMLSDFLGGKSEVDEVVGKVDKAKAVHQPALPAESNKVAIEFDAKEAAPVETVPEPVVEEAKPASINRKVSAASDVPPIKKEISDHFNQHDASGRLFSVFKQYYTCLNDMCGGTVRVTIKDGFCSLWNYDEWEEFAFVDVHENQLRIAVDPRYADALQSLQICEVPRLLSSRRNLVCVQIDDLNNTMLDVLAKAFIEVGLAAS